MKECVIEFGPLCWTEPYKFYIWLTVMVFVVAPLLLYALWRMGNGR